ncbi:MAG: hypothetical protein U0790_10950 [Isosphaeraceae bacterium]
MRSTAPSALKSRSSRRSIGRASSRPDLIAGLIFGVRLAWAVRTPGLIVDEAWRGACPCSSRACRADTFVPEPRGTTGSQFDACDVAELTERLLWLSRLPAEERAAMGRRAAGNCPGLGPGSICRGTMQALEFAKEARRSLEPAIAGERR